MKVAYSASRCTIRITSEIDYYSLWLLASAGHGLVIQESRRTLEHCVHRQTKF